MESADLIKNVLAIIPPLTFSSHKGQSGRVCVIGGSEEYTGAPYFAAISALKVGCDIAHVICCKSASPVIKSYSPELIVYPLLDVPSATAQISELLPRFHSLVIGPGLGRNPLVFKTVDAIVVKAKSANLPLVLDADALFYLNQCPELLEGYKNAILTPNVAEFKRLYASIVETRLDGEPNHHHVMELCKRMGNITVVLKGHRDIICDGESVVVCKEPGSPRRCGGQGDVLSGSMGVFSCWAQSFYSNTARTFPYNATIVAALAACMLTRKCNWLAFQKFRRSMTTSDMINEIRTAFSILFPVD